MKLRRGRCALRYLILVATATTACLLAFAAAPKGVLPEAEATCWGAGNPVTWWYPSSNPGVIESPRRGQCDRDGLYRGKVNDVKRNGACAYVKIRDAGRKWIAGRDCSPDNGPEYYHFRDRNGDHSARMWICSTRHNCIPRRVWGY
jgi:hypothetical protein